MLTRHDESSGQTLEKLYGLGFWLHQQERYSNAAEVFRVLIQAAPTVERYWVALGEAHERAGQRILALEFYSTGTVAAAPAPRCAIGRARVLRAFGRDAEADRAFEHAIELAENADNDELIALARAEAAK